MRNKSYSMIACSRQFKPNDYAQGYRLKELVSVAVLTAFDGSPKDLVIAPYKAPKRTRFEAVGTGAETQSERQMCKLLKRIVNKPSKINETVPKHALPYPRVDCHRKLSSSTK